MERAIGRHGLPEKIAIDKSGANTAVIKGIVADNGAPIELRQVTYFNNIVEQDHQVIKRTIRPMFGFEPFYCARTLLAGVETMHVLKNGQLDGTDGKVASAADQF